MKKTSKKAKAPKDAAVRATPESKPRKARELDTSTPAFLIRKLCLEHPDANVARIEELLLAESRKFDHNTVSGVVGASMGLLRTAGQLGFKLARK